MSVQLPSFGSRPHYGLMVTPDTPASASSPDKRQPSLAGELDKLIDDARKRAKIVDFYVVLWQSIDVIFGLLAAVLAAIAGAAGLASTAGRVPAAILALCAAGFAAANQFLGSGERYERNLEVVPSPVELWWRSR